MTREERTARIYATWAELKKEKNIISDTLTRGHMDDIADQMLFIMKGIFTHKKKVRKLLKFLGGVKSC